MRKRLPDHLICSEPSNTVRALAGETLNGTLFSLEIGAYGNHLDLSSTFVLILTSREKTSCPARSSFVPSPQRIIPGGRRCGKVTTPSTSARFLPRSRR